MSNEYEIKDIAQARKEILQLCGQLLERDELIDNLKIICASAYQLAGVVGAPLRFLDALSDGANGEIGARTEISDLVPVGIEECDEFQESIRLAVVATLKAAAKACTDRLNDHDKSILRDIEVIAANQDNGFWPQALAIGVLRIIQNALSSATSERDKVDAKIAALREIVIDAADEWAQYVELDNAPRRCSEHIAKAFDTVRAAQEKA